MFPHLSHSLQVMAMKGITAYLLYVRALIAHLLLSHGESASTDLLSYHFLTTVTLSRTLGGLRYSLTPHNLSRKGRKIMVHGLPSITNTSKYDIPRG